MDRSYDISHRHEFQHTFAPVDIIIPFHKTYGLVGDCIESLVSKTLGQKYTITLVDDASPNKQFVPDLKNKKLKPYPIQYITLEEHSGFGAALKAGFDQTQNPWVLFLHADCRIEHTDWLLYMLQSMKSLKKQGVKLISAKLNDGGTGGFDPCVIGNKTNREDVISEENLPLVCTLVNRDLFNHIGGFIKPYPYLWYEDEELFWRMKLMGFKQAVCGKSFVYHHGGVTAKEFMGDRAIQGKMEENQQSYINDIRTFATQNKK